MMRIRLEVGRDTTGTEYDVSNGQGRLSVTNRFMNKTKKAPLNSGFQSNLFVVNHWIEKKKITTIGYSVSVINLSVKYTSNYR